MEGIRSMNQKQFAVFCFIVFLIGIIITACIGTYQIVILNQVWEGWTAIAVAIFLTFLEIRLTQWYIKNG